MHLGLLKRWLSFKVCYWLWSGEKVAWIRWQRVTESWCIGFAGGDVRRFLRRAQVRVLPQSMAV